MSLSVRVLLVFCLMQSPDLPVRKFFEISFSSAQLSTAQLWQRRAWTHLYAASCCALTCQCVEPACQTVAGLLSHAVS